jgi:hypothetical protein
MFASPLDAALRYAARGWLVFPVRANKHPFTQHGHKEATNDPARLAAWWAQWPDAQVGVDCERSSLAVIDLDYDPTKSIDGPAVWSVLLQDHGRDLCGLIATTPRGGRHLFYSLPNPPVSSRVGVRPGVDVRAVGGYVVLPSPASPGREWRTGDPFDVDSDGVSDIDQMPGWVRELCGSHRGGENFGAESSDAMPLSGADVASIEDALKHVDPDPHDLWLQVGMALKSTGAKDQAYEIWCEWSAQSGKFTPKDQRRRWNSFKEFRWDGSEITLGTLFHLARDGGWMPGVLQELAGDIEVPEPEPDYAPRQLQKRPFPRKLLDVPGIIGELVSWMLTQSIRRQPSLCLASVLACMGALMGRRVQTRGGLRTNLYMLGIAETASGKNASLRLPQRAFALAGLSNWIGPSEWKSDSGIRSSLVDEQTRSHVCLIDEMTKFLQQVTHPNAGGHQLGIKRTLLELFSCAGDTWLAAAYADRRINAPTPLEEPHLCFYGTGVPSELFSSMDSGAIRDGFLNRLLVFVSDDALPQRQTVDRDDPPAYVLERLRELERLTRRQGNLHGVCRKVAYQEAAESLLGSLADRNDVRIMELRRSELAAFADLWARFTEHVEKLALLRSVCRDPSDRISVDDVEWAGELASWCIERTCAEAAETMADNAVQAMQKRVLRLVRDAGPMGITMAQLSRKTQWLRRSERKDVLASLVEGEEVVTQETVTLGRRKTVLIARDFLAP